VPTRGDLLLLLRAQPGSTVAELATELKLTGMGVRRHLDALAAQGLVESVTSLRRGVGRPAAGWRLTAQGLELFPRSYDRLALELLEDLVDHAGPDAVAAVFARRGEKLAAQYEEELAESTEFTARAHALARLRDEMGYAARCDATGDGDLVLTECNCAVHKVAERHPEVCAMELSLFRAVMGHGVEVTRISHTMAGDSVCAYRLRPRDDGGRAARQLSR
jgi:predicted ArsR family transcriptional regulator